MRYSQIERSLIRQNFGKWGFQMPEHIQPLVLRYSMDRFKKAVKKAYIEPVIKLLNSLQSKQL